MPYLVIKENWQRKTPYLVLKKVRKNILGKRVQEEIYIKKTKVHLIVGGKGSGKTRELMKIVSWSKKLYKREGIYINVEEPISDWYKRAGIESKEIRGLKGFEKNEKLIEKATDKVVCIDNIDKATGQKKEVIKALIRNSYICFVSATNIKEINVGIIKELRDKVNLKEWDNIDTIDLGTEFEILEVSNILAIVIVLILIIVYGQYWAFGLIFVFRYMSREGKQKK